MYTCINCGAHVDELYRRYSPTVLKVSKCDSCGNLADKYIEYDPVIVLVDLVLLEKPAYRHLLYNSEFNSYWKLLIVLIFGESFSEWTSHEEQLRAAASSLKSTAAGVAGRLSRTSAAALASPAGEYKFELLQNKTVSVAIFQGERDFYFLLGHTALALAAFVGAVLLITELRWWACGGRPQRYKPEDLVRALVIGGCAKLLGLLGIVWQHIAPEPHNALIYGYTVLCLLTAYSVVCESGGCGSVVGLAGGIWVHIYVSRLLEEYLSTGNVTLLQS